jgi:hypothetical protein
MAQPVISRAPNEANLHDELCLRPMDLRHLIRRGTNAPMTEELSGKLAAGRQRRGAAAQQ